jgi:hypothetical protein
MYSKLVIDGNSVYEIDEECMKKKERKEMPGKRRGGRGANLQAPKKGS